MFNLHALPPRPRPKIGNNVIIPAFEKNCQPRFFTGSGREIDFTTAPQSADRVKEFRFTQSGAAKFVASAAKVHYYLHSSGSRS